MMAAFQNTRSKIEPSGIDRRAVGGRAELSAGRINGGQSMSNLSRATRHRKSQSAHDYNLPRNGRLLPDDRQAADDVAKAQGAVLKGVFGRLASPSKEMAKLTGINERACRNQIAGLNSMQLHKFFQACQTVPELQDWGAMMMGIPPTDPRFQKEMARGHQEIVLRIETGGITLGKVTQ